MAQVTATAERVIDAPAETVSTALGDYETVRPQILTEHYSDYRVEPGGRVHWKLAATRKRVRDQLVDVETPETGTIVERDANSSMVTTWTLHPAEDGLTTVRVRTTWNGASGVGGFFERTFAPGGLRKIQAAVLANLARELA